MKKYVTKKTAWKITRIFLGFLLLYASYLIALPGPHLVASHYEYPGFHDSINFPLGQLILIEMLLWGATLFLTSPIHFILDQRPDSSFKTKWGLILFVFLSTLLIYFITLKQFPGDDDILSRIFQAKIFLSGKFYLSAPQDSDAFLPFNYGIVFLKDKMFSGYDPGLSILYAFYGLFFRTFVGLHQLIGAFILLIWYQILIRYYDRNTVLGVLLLLALSPFYLFQTASLHTHVPTLFFLSSLLLCLIKFRECKNRWLLILGGVCFGQAWLIRPFSSLIWATPTFAFIMRDLPAKKLFRALLLSGLGGLPFFLFFLYYNFIISGSPWVTPYSIFVTAFGVQEGFFHQGHSFENALTNFFRSFSILNTHLFGWPFSLFFIPFSLKILFKSSFGKLSLITCLVFIFCHGFFYWVDFSFGPRYYLELIPFFCLMTVLGMKTFGQIISKIPLNKSFQLESTVQTKFILNCVFALIVMWPALFQLYSAHYQGFIHLPMKEIVAKEGVKKGLIFTKIKDLNHPTGTHAPNIFLSAFYVNDLKFNGPLVFARSRDLVQDESVKERFPNLPAYYLIFDRNTEHYELVPFANN